MRRAAACGSTHRSAACPATALQVARSREGRGALDNALTRFSLPAPRSNPAGAHVKSHVPGTTGSGALPSQGRPQMRALPPEAAHVSTYQKAARARSGRRCGAALQLRGCAVRAAARRSACQHVSVYIRQQRHVALRKSSVLASHRSSSVVAGRANRTPFSCRWEHRPPAAAAACPPRAGGAAGASSSAHDRPAATKCRSAASAHRP